MPLKKKLKPSTTTKKEKKEKKVETSETETKVVAETKPVVVESPSTSNEAAKSSKKTFGGSAHGFVYIGHLPHGFFENEIRSYFSQFGKILKVRLSRSKKTGNHRGFGFIEFADEEVAKIAADTMNNYLMFNKVLKCHVIPHGQAHKEMFRNANKTFTLPKKSDFRKKFNAKKSEAQLTVTLILIIIL